MKKSLIALALAGAFVAQSAMADDVKVYGKADIGYGTVNNGTTSSSQVASQVTKLGFKGSEDLDGGVSVVWQIEQQIDIDGGTGSTHTTFAGRNSFLGLKGDFGTVLAGRHDTPYKEATRHLDMFGDQMADNRALLGGGTSTNSGGYHDMRAADVLAYVSPKLGGMVTVKAAYVNGAEVPVNNAVKGSGLSLAGVVATGPLYAAIGYQSITIGTVGTGTLGAGTTTTTATAAACGALPCAVTTTVAPATNIVANDKLQATKIGVGYYVIEPLRLVAVYEKVKSSGTGTATINNGLGRTNMYVGGVYKFGDNDIKLAYGKAGKAGTAVASGAKQLSLGVDHNLSKASTVYFQYTKISNDTNATFGISGAGTTLQNGSVVAGKTVTGMMIGVKHAF